MSRAPWRTADNRDMSLPPAQWVTNSSMAQTVRGSQLSRMAGQRNPEYALNSVRGSQSEMYSDVVMPSQDSRNAKQYNDKRSESGLSYPIQCSKSVEHWNTCSPRRSTTYAPALQSNASEDGHRNVSRSLHDANVSQACPSFDSDVAQSNAVCERQMEPGRHAMAAQTTSGTSAVQQLLKLLTSNTNAFSQHSMNSSRMPNTGAKHEAWSQSPAMSSFTSPSTGAFLSDPHGTSAVGVRVPHLAEHLSQLQDKRSSGFMTQSTYSGGPSYKVTAPSPQQQQLQNHQLQQRQPLSQPHQQLAYQHHTLPQQQQQQHTLAQQQQHTFPQQQHHTLLHQHQTSPMDHHQPQLQQHRLQQSSGVSLSGSQGTLLSSSQHNISSQQEKRSFFSGIRHSDANEEINTTTRHSFNSQGYSGPCYGNFPPSCGVAQHPGYLQEEQTYDPHHQQQQQHPQSMRPHPYPHTSSDHSFTLRPTQNHHPAQNQHNQHQQRPLLSQSIHQQSMPQYPPVQHPSQGPPQRQKHLQHAPHDVFRASQPMPQPGSQSTVYKGEQNFLPGNATSQQVQFSSQLQSILLRLSKDSLRSSDRGLGPPSQLSPESLSNDYRSMHEGPGLYSAQSRSVESIARREFPGQSSVSHWNASGVHTGGSPWKPCHPATGTTPSSTRAPHFSSQVAVSHTGHPGYSDLYQGLGTQNTDAPQGPRAVFGSSNTKHFERDFPPVVPKKKHTHSQEMYRELALSRELPRGTGWSRSRSRDFDKSRSGDLEKRHSMSHCVGRSSGRLNMSYNTPKTALHPMKDGFSSGVFPLRREASPTMSNAPSSVRGPCRFESIREREKEAWRGSLKVTRVSPTRRRSVAVSKYARFSREAPKASRHLNEGKLRASPLRHTVSLPSPLSRGLAMRERGARAHAQSPKIYRGSSKASPVNAGRPYESGPAPHGRYSTNSARAPVASKPQKRAARRHMVNHACVKKSVAHIPGSFMTYAEDFQKELEELSKETMASLLSRKEVFAAPLFLSDVMSSQPLQNSDSAGLFRMQNVMPRLYVKSALYFLESMWTHIRNTIANTGCSRVNERYSPCLLITGLPNVNVSNLQRALSNHFKSIRLPIEKIFLPIYPETGFSMGWCILDIGSQWKSLHAILAAPQFQWRGMCTQIRPFPCPQLLQLNGCLTVSSQRLKNPTALNVGDWPSSRFNECASLIYPPAVSFIKALSQGDSQDSVCSHQPSYLNSPVPFMVVTSSRRLKLAMPVKAPNFTLQLSSLFMQEHIQSVPGAFTPGLCLSAPPADVSNFSVNHALPTTRAIVDSMNSHFSDPRLPLRMATQHHHSQVSSLPSDDVENVFVFKDVTELTSTTNVGTGALSFQDNDDSKDTGGCGNDPMYPCDPRAAKKALIVESTGDEEQIAESTDDEERIVESTDDEEQIAESTDDEEQIAESTEDGERIVESTEDETMNEVGMYETLVVENAKGKSIEGEVTARESRQDEVPEGTAPELDAAEVETVVIDMDNAPISMKDGAMDNYSTTPKEHYWTESVVLNEKTRDLTFDNSNGKTDITGGTLESAVNSSVDRDACDTESNAVKGAVENERRNVSYEGTYKSELNLSNGVMKDNAVYAMDHALTGAAHDTLKSFHAGAVNDLQHDASHHGSPQDAVEGLLDQDMWNVAEGDMDVSQSDDDDVCSTRDHDTHVLTETVEHVCSSFLSTVAEDGDHGKQRLAGDNTVASWNMNPDTLFFSENQTSTVLSTMLPTYLSSASTDTPLVTLLHSSNTLPPRLTFPEVPPIAVDGEHATVKPITKEDDFGFLSLFELGNHVLLSWELLLLFTETLMLWPKHLTDDVMSKPPLTVAAPWTSFFCYETEGLQLHHIREMLHTVKSPLQARPQPFEVLPYVVYLSRIPNRKVDDPNFMESLISTLVGGLGIKPDDPPYKRFGNDVWGLQYEAFAETNRCRGDGFLLLPSQWPLTDLRLATPVMDDQSFYACSSRTSIPLENAHCPLQVFRALVTSAEVDFDLSIIAIVLSLWTEHLRALLIEAKNQTAEESTEPCGHQPQVTHTPTVCTDNGYENVEPERNSCTLNLTDAVDHLPTFQQLVASQLCITNDKEKRKFFEKLKLEESMGRCDFGMSSCSAQHFIESYFFSLDTFFSLPVMASSILVERRPCESSLKVVSKRSLRVTSQLYKKLQSMCTHTLPNLFLDTRARAKVVYAKALELLPPNWDSSPQQDDESQCLANRTTAESCITPILHFLMGYIEKNFFTVAHDDEPCKKKQQSIQWLMFENEADVQATVRIPCVTYTQGISTEMPFELTGDSCSSFVEAKFQCALKCLQYFRILEDNLFLALGVSEADDLEQIELVDARSRTTSSVDSSDEDQTDVLKMAVEPQPTTWYNLNEPSEPSALYGTLHLSTPQGLDSAYWTPSTLRELQHKRLFRFIPLRHTLSTPQHRFLLTQRVQTCVRAQEKLFKWTHHNLLFQPKEEDVITATLSLNHDKPCTVVTTHVTTGDPPVSS